MKSEPGYKRRNRKIETVVVTKRTGQINHVDFVFVTFPLGVLKSSNGESPVCFTPELSQPKRDAIEGVAISIYNEVILRFQKNQIFWPPNIHQLNYIN